MIPTQENFDYAVNLLLDNITNRYERFCRKSQFGSVEDKINQFADELNIETGRKYLKITAGSSVWGFVSLTNPKFKFGDILKAKNYKTPALNQARGNVPIASTNPYFRFHPKTQRFGNCWSTMHPQPDSRH